MPDKQGDAVDFSTLIMGFASAAMINLGLAPDPQSGQSCVDVVVARQNISIIAMLHEKTRGNLSEKEDQLMEQVLFELRQNYLRVMEGRK